MFQRYRAVSYPVRFAALNSTLQISAPERFSQNRTAIKVKS